LSENFTPGIFLIGFLALVVSLVAGSCAGRIQSEGVMWVFFSYERQRKQVTPVKHLSMISAVRA
jgi:hypothetical protein